ncbi:N-acetylneuraminate synthase [Rubricoccus marinus]|uniref:N-acetylneuraminate synthase n=1 Tax=Rubricoccus marinus TaxID=716817 RepID=A0A259U3X1_9BACT|nr:N-acetylneuraminate synthase [Rubricoccus marinus]OZC04695.1 N-acetylneuraminate synthase [Rubricoccus marinus]
MYIIAEAGVNHNGSVDRAIELVEAAARAGADAVKFQTFRADAIVSASAPKAAYQTATTGSAESQLEMVRKLELDRGAHERIQEACRQHGIEFLSTPFDLASVDLLVRELGVPRLKVPSGEVTNAPLLLRVARQRLPLFVSTGMCTLGDVEDALGVIAFGLSAPEAAAPSREAFRHAFASGEGQAALREHVTLLHCTTEYPAPLAEVNLRAMGTLRHAFGLPVGYSDHTEGITVPVAAAALGATVIEKHFTLDRTLPGPDHAASLEPGELAAMVQGIRETALALGKPGKRPTAVEAKNVSVVRKSIVAARPLARGEVLTEEAITTKRPGGGISPMDFWEAVGREVSRDFAADEPIRFYK